MRHMTGPPRVRPLGWMATAARHPYAAWPYLRRHLAHLFVAAKPLLLPIWMMHDAEDGCTTIGKAT